jgi:transglutaminase-like putative cysteine protease
MRLPYLIPFAALALASGPVSGTVAGAAFSVAAETGKRLPRHGGGAANRALTPEPEKRRSLAPDLKYPVSAIPAALRENAHAVLRADEERVVVKNASRLVHTVHRVVTILDAAGDDFGSYTVSYSQLDALSYLRGAVYDENGRLLHQLRASDVRDQGASGSNLQTDVRVRMADLRQPTGPYTVEFDYEIVSDNLLFYPAWQPQDEAGLAVEQATLHVTTPASLPLRYQERQLPTGVTAARSDANGVQTYQWELRELPALDDDEPASPPLFLTAPSVLLAADAFVVQGHAGSQASWQSLGKWNYELNAGRDQLSPEVQAKVQALVKDAPDARTRVRRVYELLQGSTRYVSVQLGLGGWQTAPASAVSNTGYGDCKALSNYTKALLAAAGVPAYVALVGAGADRPDVSPTFPASSFNHAILCAPLPVTSTAPADTVWLECTSQTDAFNYLGSFTGNRHALLLTPLGGQLVATPRYTARDNRRERRLELFLDALGNATASVRTLRTGQEQDQYASLLHGLGPDEQKKYVTDRLHLPTFTLTKFNLAAGAPTAGPAVVETLGLSLPAYAPPAGKRVFISPNLLSRLPALPAQIGTRQAAVWQPSASLQADTVRLHLPVGFRTETLPAAVQFQTPYGTYASQFVTLPDGTVQYIRRLELHRLRLPATAYPGYVDFRRKVSIADKAQVVLVKTDA